MTKERTPRTMAAIIAGDMRFVVIFWAVGVDWLASAWYDVPVGETDGRRRVSLWSMKGAAVVDEGIRAA